MTGFWDDNDRGGSLYGNRFMFQGREYLSELGIYDYRNRFYYPALGRFLQSDPLGFGGGDANLFRYCGGDPVNWRDPNGLQDIPLTPSQDYINGLTAQYYTEQSAGITAVNNYISAFNTGISITSSPEYRATFGAVQVVASFVTAEESVALLGTPAEPIGVGGLIMSVHEFSSGIDHIRAAGNGEGLYLGIPLPLLNYPMTNFPAFIYEPISSGTGYYNVDVPDPSSDLGYRLVVVGISDTFSNFHAGGGLYHYGTTGNLIAGPVSGPLGYFNPSLTSTGGGDWQGISPGWANFPGPQAGEGTHPVSPDLQ